MDKKRRKIIIIGPTESILTKRGNRHPALAEYLVNKGYDLQYLTSDFYHAEKRWFSEEEIKAAQRCAPYNLVVFSCLGYHTNISVQRIVSNLFLSLKLFLYLLPRLNRSMVLILPSRPVEMIFAGAMLRLIRRNSVLLDIQDIWPDMLVVKSRTKRTLFRWYCNFYLYPSLRFIDKFIHVAPSFTKWLHRYAPNAKSTFVPLGFDDDRWSSLKENSVTKPEDKLRLVCVSQLTFQFDVIPLLKALKGCDNVHLLIIGEDGSGERFPEVMEFISNEKLENVEFAGIVDRNEMSEYLKYGTIGIVPMVSTSIPNKVFDYIGANIPILVFGDNDSSIFAHEYSIGWSVAFDENEIGHFLKTITNIEISEKKLNILRIRDRFNRKVLHQQIEGVILNMVQNSVIVNLME